MADARAWLRDADENAQAGVAEQSHPGAGTGDSADSQMPTPANKDSGRRDSDQHSAKHEQGRALQHRRHREQVHTLSRSKIRLGQ
jgi:hypothetical protein